MAAEAQVKKLDPIEEIAKKFGKGIYDQMMIDLHSGYSPAYINLSTLISTLAIKPEELPPLLEKLKISPEYIWQEDSRILVSGYFSVLVTLKIHLETGLPGNEIASALDRVYRERSELMWKEFSSAIGHNATGKDHPKWQELQNFIGIIKSGTLPPAIDSKTKKVVLKAAEQKSAEPRSEESAAPKVKRPKHVVVDTVGVLLNMAGIPKNITGHVGGLIRKIGTGASEKQAHVLDFSQRYPEAYAYATKCSLPAQFFSHENDPKEPKSDWHDQRTRFIERFEAKQEAVRLIEKYKFSHALLYQASREDEWQCLLNFIELDGKTKGRIITLIDEGKIPAKVLVEAERLNIVVEMLEKFPNSVEAITSRQLNGNLLHDPKFEAQRGALADFLPSMGINLHAQLKLESAVLYSMEPKYISQRTALTEIGGNEKLRNDLPFVEKYVKLTADERKALRNFATKQPVLFAHFKNAEFDSLTAFVVFLERTNDTHKKRLTLASSYVGSRFSMAPGLSVPEIFNALAIAHDITSSRTSLTHFRLERTGLTIREGAEKNEIYKGAADYDLVTKALVEAEALKGEVTTDRKAAKKDAELLPVAETSAKGRAAATRTNIPRKFVTAGRVVTSMVNLPTTDSRKTTKIERTDLVLNGKLLLTKFAPSGNEFADLAKTLTPTSGRER